MGMNFLSYFRNYAAALQTFQLLWSSAILRNRTRRNVWCRYIVPFSKELGSDNLIQECQLGGSLAGKLSARVLSIDLSFL
jgi:hypothetical protein